MAAVSGRVRRRGEPSSRRPPPVPPAAFGRRPAEGGPWRAYRRCSAFADRWLVRLLGCVLAVIVGIMLLAVWTRYVDNDPVAWSEQLSRILFVWITFLGAAVLYRRGYHLAVTYFLDLLPPPLRWWVRLVNQLSLVALFAILLVYGSELAWNNLGQTFGALDITPSSFYFAAPVSAALMLFFSLEHFAALAAERRGERPGRGGEDER